MLGRLAGTHKPVEFPLELSAKSVHSFRSAKHYEGTCAFLRRERQNVNIEEDMQEEYATTHEICHLRQICVHTVHL